MKKIFAIIIYCVLFAILLFVLSPIFVPKWRDGTDNYSGSIVRGFYDEPDGSLDVLFMGNSDTYRSIIPIELWDKYGIASYVYTSPGQRTWTGYYVLLDALRSQHPDIIVYNIDSIGSDNQSLESCYRKAFDNMEWSPVKIKAVFFDNRFNFGLAKKLAFAFPILRFHDRYSELTLDDFKYAYGSEHFSYKGYDMITTNDGYMGGKSYMKDTGEVFEMTDYVREYLDKFVEKCKEEGITLILMEAPTSDSWNYAKHKAMSEYAKEKGLEFIDLNMHLDEMKFDWTKSTPDKGDHLNIYGAEKATKFIGKYLKDNYNIPDRREDENYKQWFIDSDIYHKDAQNAKKESQNN